MYNPKQKIGSYIGLGLYISSYFFSTHFPISKLHLATHKHTHSKDKNGVKDTKRVTNKDREMMNNDDRISRLPNELIHHIYSRIDNRFVQSSLLSNRWRNTWKSHPRLNFEKTRFSY